MILITGAATRIGAAIARRLVNKNKMVIHYHSSSAAAQALMDELRAQGAEIILWQQDLRAPDLAESVQALISQHGPMDALVNNAAVFYPEKDNSDGMAPELQRDIMTINCHAPLCLMQEMAKALPQGARGNIINMLDQRVLNVSHTFPSYTASKTALWTATKSMAVQLAPHIRVNAIAPGHVLPTQGEDMEKFAARRAKVPLGFGPEPEDIAAAVEFILRSPSMTGACIPLDGGEHLVAKQKPIS